jgi:hypothetical protein
MSIRSARVVGGRYQLHTMLGRGATAAVWAGIDTRLDRPVAIKVLDGSVDPVMVRRLDREARTVAMLAHPNIVAVHDLGTEGGVPFLVMELVEGGDLQRRLKQGPLDARQAVAVAIQICAALDAAHAAGIVHGDIKPDNILLTATGSVKVCDFGIARLQQATRTSGTRSPTAVGTSEYMAPEQAAGGPVDTRTDLYALGCVLYAMLIGGPPFSGDDPMGVLWQQVHQPPAPIASLRTDVPRDLEALVMRLLAKDPADRPHSAGQVHAELISLPDLPAGSPDSVPLAAELAPAHATAAVVTPTRILPAIDLAPGPPSARTGLRPGPAGIAAMAVGTATVTAIVIGILSAGPSAHQVAVPDASRAAAASAAATVASTASRRGTVNALRAAIQAQVVAGQIDARDANDIAGRLDDIDSNLARGRTGDAATKVSDLRNRLSQLRSGGKITDAGFVAIIIAINKFAATLPQNGNR